MGMVGVLWACGTPPDLLDQLLQGQPIPVVQERIRGTLSFAPPDRPLPSPLRRMDQRVQEHTSQILRWMEAQTGLSLHGTLRLSAWAKISSRRFLLRYFAPGTSPIYAGVALSLVVEDPMGRVERIHLYLVPFE